MSAADPDAQSATPAWVVVALGSNLGDSVTTVRAAIERLRALSAAPFLTSSFWRTSPVDCPPGSPSFINAVVAFFPQAGETPDSLHRQLQALEKEFGRLPKRQPNEDRPLDLDLIAFGSEIRTSAELTLPHPRAAQRRFVLAPLAEILPGYILAGQTLTVTELLTQLRSDEVLKRLPASDQPA